jgi:hypothetical protein
MSVSMLSLVNIGKCSIEITAVLLALACPCAFAQEQPVMPSSTVSAPSILKGPDNLQPAPAISSIGNAAPLSGNITAGIDLSALQATVERETISPPGLQAFRVSVKNGTKAALILNGDRARMSTEVEHPESSKNVLEQVWPTPTPVRQVGAIVMDMLTTGMFSAVRDAKIQKGPVLGRYGRDQARRSVESMRFGRRILWPGDDTTGTIYFDAAENLNPKSLEMPVSRWPKDEPIVMLRLCAQ